MTHESLISGLSTDDKLAAMELFWRDVPAKQQVYALPKWHEGVTAD